jgi:hypothetical protein
MKKLLTIILVLISGYIQAQEITYTPMNAAGYQFKYFISDSGHTVPFKDTALDRGTTRPGSLVCFTGDSAVYWYNGLYWRPIGANVTTGTITSGIDSATFYNGNLCFWTEGASQCFDLTTYFCNSELNHDSTKILFYTCTGDLIDSLFLPIAYVDVDYPITKRQVGDTTYIGIDALQGQNGLLFGGLVSHDTLYTYDVTAAIYSINGTEYSSSSGSVTLDPSDGTYDRQDIIALDTNENIISITGTPGADPLLPQIDPLSQVFLTSVYVKALSTEPDDINRENIYDENVENWTRTIASGLTVNADNATNVFHLLKSMDVGTWATTKSIVFARTAGVIPAGTYSLLKMFINLKAPLASTGSIQVIFLNGSAQQVGSTTLTAAHGFVKTTAGVYQNVTVPMTTGPVTRIQIVFAGVGDGAYLDYIQLQGGISNGVSPYVTNVFRKPATDSVFKVINGVNVFAYTDSIGTGGGSVTKYYQEIISTAGQTTFSFTTVPTTSTGYMVYVNGAAIPKTYYSVSTNDITFTTGLVEGDSVVLQGIQ